MREFLARLIRHPVISVKALADASGRSTTHTYRAIDGDRNLTVPELRSWLPEIQKAADGMEIVEGLLGFGAVGWQIQPVVKVAPTTGSIAEAALKVMAETGSLSGTVARAVADGTITSDELGAILGDLERAKRRLAEFEAKVKPVPIQSAARKA